MMRPSAMAMTPSGSQPTGKTMFAIRAVSSARSASSRSACRLARWCLYVELVDSARVLRMIDFVRLNSATELRHFFSQFRGTVDPLLRPQGPKTFSMFTRFGN